jgi:hypothetical protein
MNMDFNMGRWMEYIGKNPNYQGHQALLRPIHDGDRVFRDMMRLDREKMTMAQFPDISPDWLLFLKSDFQRPGAKPVF